MVAEDKSGETGIVEGAVQVNFGRSEHHLHRCRENLLFGPLCTDANLVAELAGDEPSNPGLCRRLIAETSKPLQPNHVVWNRLYKSPVLSYHFILLYMEALRMVKSWLYRGLIISGIMITGTTLAAQNCRGAVTPSQRLIVQDIRKGVSFLLSQEKPHILWERKKSSVPYMNDIGGKTALVTEALLDVEQTLHMRRLNIFKPAMKQAIHFLVKHFFPTTYYASFSANALALLPHRAAYRAALLRDARFLLESIRRDGGYTYAWGPPAIKKAFGEATVGQIWDNSNTQYGVLGVWACAHYGIGIPQRYWEVAASHWRRKQLLNGTWDYSYFPGSGFSHSPSHHRQATFTPAGVASLLICDEFIGASEAGDRPIIDPAVLRGLAWINKNFLATATNDQYQMYCYERVGLASGLTEFGGHNWYNDFAHTLTVSSAPNPQGWWQANGFPSGNGYASRVIGTAYSLLLLDRGLNPIFMSKLQYGKNYYGRWNLRPRDVANMTSFVADHTEAPLSWQVVNINSPVAQWLNSPILFISGNRNPKFTKLQLHRLREYIDAGGLIYCSPVENSSRFRRAMIKDAREVVRNRYEFKLLSPKSELMTMQPYYHMHMRTLAMSNGVRYLWVISPEDISAVWQRRQFSRQSYWQFPINLYLYCTGKGSLGTRLSSLVVGPPHGKPVRSVNVGLLKFTGNWNPEPGAWNRMAKLAAADFQTSVKVSVVTPPQLTGSGVKVLDLTGTGKAEFSSGDIADIRKFLNSGGMLFTNAAGGNLMFSDSVQNLIQKLYPHTPLVRLPTKCSIYEGNMPGGINASRAFYRGYYISAMGFRKSPQLLGIKKNGRWVVIFSQQDITSGLLGTNTWGILGYAPKTAIALTRNVLCYAAAH